MKDSVAVTAVERDRHAEQVARSSLLFEFAFVGLGYLIYSQVRGIAAHRVTDAFANARHIVSIERSLGIFKELTVQRWVLPSSALIDIFNVIYVYGFFPLIIGTAIWLYLKRPATYKLARTAFLASGAIAVCIFLTLPTAPPRLLDVGIIDTLGQTFTPTYSSIPGVNHYAALPSMHVGWTFLLAVSIYISLPGSKWRWIGILMPLTMFTATIVTGNHWFIDTLLGLIVALAGLGVALLLTRYTDRRMGVATASASARSP